MTLATRVLYKNDDLPIRTSEPVHSGKVRSVYWLTAADSARLIAQRGYAVQPDTQLAVMVISDRISAFDCIWRGQDGLDGVPGKGAALNAISLKWFSLLTAAGIAQHHVLESPHPLVWIVQRARPLKIEAIVRQYVTGSLWRAYAEGERSICGITLPEHLTANQKLPEPIITPSTKGIIRGLPDITEADDVNISRAQILAHLSTFGFATADDVSVYENMLLRGFALISQELAKMGQIFVDTKFEFGYATDAQGHERLIVIDEVGTPDSSRLWDAAAYSQGRIVENSKEGFRQYLLSHVPDRDVLLNKYRMPERFKLAQSTLLPPEVLLDVGTTYVSTAEKILGHSLPQAQEPRAEIIQTLADGLQICL